MKQNYFRILTGMYKSNKNSRIVFALINLILRAVIVQLEKKLNKIYSKRKNKIKSWNMGAKNL